MRGPLRERNFQIYLLGNTISWLGTWAQRIGVGWLSWDLTHKTAWVGAISLAQLLPLIVLGPLFGTLLDRHDHRRYALGVNLVLSLLAVVLYALTALHFMRIELLFVMAVLLGIANSAYQAVRLSMVNNIVVPEQLQAAIAINSVVFNLTRAIGPAIAGVIVANFGIAMAFAANAVSFIGILVALLIVRLRPRKTQPVARGLVVDSLEGLRYFWQHAELRQLLILSGVTSLFGRGIVELLPAFADAVFRRGTLGLANLTTAAGIGAIVGALLLSQTRSGAGLRRVTRYSTLLLGGAICGFGFCTSFLPGVLTITLIGFLIVLCSVGLQVRVQTAVADDYRGRVMGLWIAVNLAGPGLGAAMAGVTAQLIGLRLVTVAAGALCLVLVAWITVSEGTGVRRRGPPTSEPVSP